MKLKIEIQCECGNHDTVEIKKGKEFRQYDIFTEEFTIQDSINESEKFRSNQTWVESFHISCNKCNEKIELFLIKR
jgi:hypothetical protein